MRRSLGNGHINDKDNVKAAAFYSYQSYFHRVTQNNDMDGLCPF